MIDPLQQYIGPSQAEFDAMKERAEEAEEERDGFEKSLVESLLSDLPRQQVIEQLNAQLEAAKAVWWCRKCKKIADADCDAGSHPWLPVTEQIEFLAECAKKAEAEVMMYRNRERNLAERDKKLRDAVDEWIGD